MKNFVMEGKTLTLTAPYALTSGQGLLVGSLFGVASGDAAISTEVEAITDGVFTLTKATGAAWTVGALIYWDNAARNLAGRLLCGLKQLSRETFISSWSSKRRRRKPPSLLAWRR